MVEVERSPSDVLRSALIDRSASVAVVGLGYVGLPLAVALAQAGFCVRAIDVDKAKVARLWAGESYLQDVPPQAVAEVLKAGKLQPTTLLETASEIDVFLVCVPTPATAAKAPDVSFIRAATESIAQSLRPGQLFILQSTTYPGTTDEVVLPILERTGLQGGQDFFLAFSPERINPGDREHTIATTPKVVGGLTPLCGELAAELMRTLHQEVKIVSSLRAAELTKLLENIFRSVNIALVNELAKLSEVMGIDFWEVIDAAATKPFGFMPFYPGAGVGGHCIPVDPYYLSWKAREYDFYTRFVELAGELNQSMPFHLVGRVTEALNRAGRTLPGACVLVLGVAFKKNVDDARNSPAERVIELLLRKGAEVIYHDPYVPEFTIGGDALLGAPHSLRSVPLTDDLLTSVDGVVIVTGHDAVDYGRIADRAPLVVDSCNATASLRRSNIVRVGAPL